MIYETWQKEMGPAPRTGKSSICIWTSTPSVSITTCSHGCINLGSARSAQPLGLTPPGFFLAVAVGRLTAASFSLTTDQRFQIALLTDRPLRRWVNNRSKDLGPRNCEEELVLPERCSIRLNTFGASHTSYANAPNVFGFLPYAESTP